MSLRGIIRLRRPKKRFVATTNSDHRLPIYPNVAAEMDIAAPDQLWVADLTYIRLGHEFIYLAVVLDACSRRCLGWSLGRRLDADLATSALKTALKGRKPAVHHSDRGVQIAAFSMLPPSTQTCSKTAAFWPMPTRRSATSWKRSTTRSACIPAWATCRPPSLRKAITRTETRTRPSHLNQLSHTKGSLQSTL
jgi:hypothetical protein